MRSLFLAILSIFFVFSAFISCNEHTNNSIDKIDFDTLSIDSVCPLFKNYEKPSCHINIKMSWPKEGTPSSHSSSFGRFISLMFKEDDYNSFDSFYSLTRDYIRNYFIEYLSQGKEAIDNYGEDMDAAATWMSYEEITNGEVMYNDHGIIGYKLSRYSYTGGAHGQTDVELGVYDVHSQTSVTLHNIFKEIDLPKVNELIVNKLMSDYNCSTVEELSENDFFSPEEIEATENFMLNDSAMVWLYDPYEIAPYSMGEIQVELKWDMLKDLILPESPVKRIFSE